METFARKPKATQQTQQPTQARSSSGFPGRSRDSNLLLHLQRHIGNRALTQLVQGEAEGSRGDSIDSALPVFPHNSFRMPAPVRAGKRIQAKLQVGSSGDQYEQEADRVADYVLQRDIAVNGRQPKAVVQTHLSRQASSDAPEVSNDFEARLNRTQSGGNRLPNAVRADFEQRLGFDFSGVRIHSSDEAARMNQELGARAFTHGRDIYFAGQQYQPQSADGRRLLAHELTHVVQQTGSSPALQRQQDEPETRPVPAWALTTPEGALPGVEVPGYEDPRGTYSEVDRSEMLAALNRRVQINGARLASFFHNLRLVWTDLVIDLSSENVGLSFGTQEMAGIISSVITAPLGPLASAIAGALASTVVNVTNEVMASNELEERRRRLRRLMVAPTVSSAGESGANGRLAELLLDAVGYATWLQVAPLSDLGKFRIPPEFPRVSRSDIAAAVAGAIISHRARRSTNIRRAVLEAWDESGVFYGRGLEVVGDDILLVSLDYGHEANLRWALPTHPALRRAVLGHRIGELADVPVVVQFFGLGRGYTPVWEQHGSRVVFGRAAGRIYLRGDFLGLFYLHKYIHPEDHAPTFEDIYGSPFGPGLSGDELHRRVDNLKARYTQDALLAARRLLRDDIDPFVLPRARH